MYQVVEILAHEIRESLMMALAALRINKLRSILTLLGIAVGVFSIVAVMTAMEALVNSIQNGLSQLGTNTFQVQKTPMFNSGSPQERAKFRNRKNIQYSQGLLVAERATLAKAVGLESWKFGKVVASRDGLKTNPSVQVAGENVEGFTTNNWTIAEGRMFNENELNEGRPVAVLGPQVVEKIFPKSDPIGEVVRVDGKEYTVIGTIESQGSILGGNNDNFIVIPIVTLFSVYGPDLDSHIMVQSTSRETYEDCIDQVRGILRTARHVDPADPDDFYIFSNDTVIEQFNSFTLYLRLGIMLVSAIALLAAGVGIMNIMLVSVTERTREIGIRKAIGAKKKNVLSQFILEAVVLSEFGGVAGILAGVGSGNLIALVLQVPPVIPWDWVAIGFAICSIIGVVFGVYPAWKASNLDPIESLRYE
ncbi:MAG TPA: ABC transporter permease [Bacteroidota bacterium]|nr:ABC transporter permease [Bacteroidota bacterium]